MAFNDLPFLMRLEMKKIMALIVLTIFLLNTIPLSYANPTADEILNGVRNRNDGSDYASNVTLNLIASDGDVRARKLYMLQKDTENNEEKMLMYFHSPADVRGVGFLMEIYPEVADKVDNQWMYFPAFRKIRRISANDKRGSFMGSTFSYADMDKIRVTDYQSTLIGEEMLFERPTWIIERIPVSQDVINKTGYHKTQVWIDKERHIELQQHYFNAKDILFKTQQSIQVSQIQGIWTIVKSVMKNTEKHKSSEMIFTNIKYNVDLDEQQISKRTLKRGLHTSDIPALIQNKE